MYADMGNHYTAIRARHSMPGHTHARASRAQFTKSLYACERGTDGGVLVSEFSHVLTFHDSMRFGWRGQHTYIQNCQVLTTTVR